MSFEYNRIRPDLVKSVDLLHEDADEWQEYVSNIYDDSRKIPEGREEILEHGDVESFENIVFKLLNNPDEPDYIADAIYFDATLWHYVENPQEAIQNIINNGWRSDVEIEIDRDAPVKYRGLCKHSSNDKYVDDDDAYCCWECSNKDNRRPKKFMVGDSAGSKCELNIVHENKIRSHIRENLEINTECHWGQKLAEAGYSANDVSNMIPNIRDRDRSTIIKFAFEIAFPEFEYHYNRAEALLRDIDSDVAKEAKTGEGGRRYEYYVKEKLRELGFELSPRRVFKIKFRDDLHPRAFSNYGVRDSSEAMYKEADAVLFDGGQPIICEIFTQRNPKEKRRQLKNYAELFELATGDEPDTWLVTKNSMPRLTLDTISKISQASSAE